MRYPTEPPSPIALAILAVIGVVLLLWWWRKPPHWRDLYRQYSRHREPCSTNDWLMLAGVVILVLFWYWLQTLPWGAWSAALGW